MRGCRMGTVSCWSPPAGCAGWQTPLHDCHNGHQTPEEHTVPVIKAGHCMGAHHMPWPPATAPGLAAQAPRHLGRNAGQSGLSCQVLTPPLPSIRRPYRYFRAASHRIKPRQLWHDIGQANQVLCEAVVRHMCIFHVPPAPLVAAAAMPDSFRRCLQAPSS